MAANDKIETHPVQNHHYLSREPQVCPAVVTLLAYEVYCELFGKQEALITGGCRGGFGVGELVAYLYAHSFPRSEWRKRTEEAFKGMKLG